MQRDGNVCIFFKVYKIKMHTGNMKEIIDRLGSLETIHKHLNDIESNKRAKTC